MEYLENTFTYIDKNVFQLSLTAIVIILFFVFRSLLRKLVRKHAQFHEMARSRELYVNKLINLVLFIFFASLAGIIWGVSFRGLSIYFASIFTIIGVALFASWSILSNLTASVILFFFFPYRIGDKIKIIDGDNSVEGKIMDITLFYLRLETEDKELYSYPNNVALQKPIRGK